LSSLYKNHTVRELKLNSPLPLSFSSDVKPSMRKEKTVEITDDDGADVKPKTPLRKRKTHEMSVCDDEKTAEPPTKRGVLTVSENVLLIFY